MAFFAAGVVKGALVLKHEAKKSRIRNSIISAPGEENVGSDKGTVTIQPDWWGGNGGSYPHQILYQPEEPSASIPQQSDTTPQSPKSALASELNDLKEETGSDEKLVLDPASIPVEDDQPPEDSRVRHTGAPAGSFSAQLRRGRSQASETRTRIDSAGPDAPITEPNLVAGSFSAELRRMRTQPLPPRPASFAARSRTVELSGVAGSYSSEIRRSRSRASAPAPIASKFSVDNATTDSHPAAGSFSDAMRRVQSQETVSYGTNLFYDVETNDTTTFLPRGTPTPGSFAAASSTPRASVRLTKAASSRLARRSGTVLEFDGSSRRARSVLNKENVRVRNPPPKSGSFLEATTTNAIRTPNAQHHGAGRSVAKSSKHSWERFIASTTDGHAMSSAERDGM